MFLPSRSSWGRFASLALLGAFAAAETLAAESSSGAGDWAGHAPQLLARAWAIPAYGVGLVVAVLVWAIRDHRRRLEAQRAGYPADPPPPRPALERPWFRRRLLEQPRGAPVMVRMASGGFWVVLMIPLLLLAMRPAQAWPAALGTAILSAAWYAAMRRLATTPQSMGAERHGKAIVVRYSAPRAAAMVLGGSSLSILVVFLMMLLASDPTQSVSVGADLALAGLALLIPLLVGWVVLAETWITEEGVSRSHRWSRGHRRFLWDELTGARLFTDEKTPPRLELLGFTNIARVRVGLDCDGVGDLAASMLKYMAPASIDANRGLRELLEGMARRAGA